MNNKKQKNKNSSPVKPALLGTLASFGLILIFACLFSAVALKSDTPSSVCRMFALICTAAASFLGSFVASKMFPPSPFAAGMLSCVLPICAVLFASLVINGNSGTAGAVLTVIPLFAFLGAFASSRGKKSAKHAMKKALRQHK